MHGSHVHCTGEDLSHINLCQERSIVSTLHTFHLPLPPLERGTPRADMYDFSVEKKKKPCDGLRWFKLKEMSNCQKDVKLSKRCQIVKKMSNVKKSNT